MNKILVIRVGRAGYMVMITPSLRALLDCFQGHELQILTCQDYNNTQDFARETALLEKVVRSIVVQFFMFSASRLSV